jgi:hypothetical protein
METKVQEHLRRKRMAAEGLPQTMYVVHSTREEVKMFSVEIIEIGLGSRRRFHGEEDWTQSTRYRLKESPFETEIYDGDTFGEYNGHGTGCGDLWGYSMFCSLDEAVAKDLLEKETKRVYDKYQDPNRPPEQLLTPAG